MTRCNTVYLCQYSVLFTFVSTLFTFASTVFFFVSTVLNFASTVFFFKSYVTIAPPHPPASIHVYLHYSGRGRGSPATNQPPPPEYLLTQHSYKPTPLTRNNTQQHIRTPNNTQQQYTTALKYIKLSMSPCLRNLGHNFFCGTITLWAISRDILRGPRLFWPLNYPLLHSGQFKGSKKSWPPQNVPWNGS